MYIKFVKVQPLYWLKAQQSVQIRTYLKLFFQEVWHLEYKDTTNNNFRDSFPVFYNN